MSKHSYKIKQKKTLKKMKVKMKKSKRIKMPKGDKFGPPSMSRADVEIERLSRSSE